jgi:OTU domain-containing protein 6
MIRKGGRPAEKPYLFNLFPMKYLFDPNKKQSKKERRLISNKIKLDLQYENAQEEAENMPNLKLIETDAILDIIRPLKLHIKDIQPDGHCLYNAVADQIAVLDSTQTITAKHLRTFI